MVVMKNLIGGLFKTQESANLAYQALQKSGFASENINMFVHKPRNTSVRSNNVKIQEIGISASIGALFVGVIGAFVGYMVGRGEIILPGLEPGSIPLSPAFVISSVIAGMVFGVLTGSILGTAARLVMSREKAEIISMGIEQGGLLVVVSAGDSQSETKARRVMEENGAMEVGNPSKKWDLKAWLSVNEVNPSLKNLVETRQK